MKKKRKKTLRRYFFCISCVELKLNIMLFAYDGTSGSLFYKHLTKFHPVYGHYLTMAHTFLNIIITTTTTTRVLLKGRLEGRFRDQRGVQTSGNVGSDALVRRHRDAFLLGRARGDGDALKRSIGRFESVFNALIAKRYLGGTSVGFGSGGEPETTSDDVLGELFGTRPRGPGVVFFERLFLRTRGRGEARLLCGL